MTSILTAIALAASAASAQQGHEAETVRQRGVPQVGTPQVGTPPIAVPQRNPDGSVPRTLRRWRAPVTIIYGGIGQDVIAYPTRFNLPLPASGLVWRRIGNDAVLYDVVRGSILEVRGRWFG